MNGIMELIVVLSEGMLVLDNNNIRCHLKDSPLIVHAKVWLGGWY